jgi:hypothetical protein
MPTNQRPNLRTNRVLRTTALGTALLVLTACAVPRHARAQTANGAPAAGSNPSGSFPSGSRQESPVETFERLRRQSGASSSDWPPPAFRPETPQEIARKLQTGEYHIDRNEKPAWYWIARIAILVVTVSMFIVTLVMKLVGKGSPQSGPASAQDAVRKADALAETARAKYKNLARLIDRKNFVERRAALVSEGAAVEKLFRQSAEQYRSASEKFAQPAELNTPATAETRLWAQACVQRAASQTALADVAALLGDPQVTSPEEFARRAQPLSAAANAAAEMSRQLMKQDGGGASG